MGLYIKMDEFMAITRSEHPSTVAVYQVKHRRLLFVAALIGSFAFLALGVWIALYAPRIGQKAVGALTVAFFGWIAVVAAQRIRQGAAIQLSHEGIHYAFAPNYQTRRLISWRDIEGFGIWRLFGQELNLVRLARYDSLAGQFSDTEAARTLRFARVAHLAYAGAGGSVASVSDLLHFNRVKFGGEICLGWPDRDRSAARFQELLTVWKNYCTGADLTSPGRSDA